MSVRLRHVADVNPANAVTKSLQLDAAVSFFPMELVGFGNESGPGKEVALAEVRDGFTSFVEGDVLVAKITPSFENGKGAHAVGLINGVGFGTTELHVLRPRQIHPDYLNWLILSMPFRQGGAVEMRGAAGQQRVPTEYLASFRIPVIYLEPQSLIADFLDRETHRIDALVDAKRRMIALLEEKRAAIRERLLGELGQESRAPLKRQADVTVGIVVQPARLYSEDGVPVLRGLNVGEGKVTQKDLRFISDEANREHSKSILLEGDVVVVRTGQAGAAAVVPPWAVGGNCVDLLLVHPSRSLNSKYLEYWLNSSLTVHQVEKFSVGAIQSHYNVSALRELLVAIPPLDEQRRIVQELDRREGAIAAVASKLRTQLDLLAEYRQALITQAVTGQLDEATLKGGKPVDEAVGVIPE